MPWTQDSAARYEIWANSPCGSYALRQEEHLLQGCIAHWPRRKQRLLDIGCGTGVFLEFLWSCGFDLTAVDSSPDMLTHARERMGERVEFHVAKAEHLPFDDREFDYATIMTVLEFVDDPARVLREAARVARKGLLVTFLNRQSVYGLRTRLSRRDSILKRAHWFSWLEMRALLHKTVSPGVMFGRSVLIGPPCSWRGTPVLRQVNALPVWPWIGAVTAVRVDFGPKRTQTPLLAWNTEPTM